jgi:hypothetical protein
VLSIVLTMMLAQPGPAAAKPLTADVVGYGRLELAVKHNLAFTCEDSRHAELLLSKLQADFTWDSLLGPRKIRLPDGTPGIALDNGQILVFACQENRVGAVVGTSPAEVATALAQEGFDRRKVHFVPAKRHPLALDFFDLRSVSLYFHPLNILDLAKGLKRYDRSVLARPADFWAPFHFGYSQFGPYFGFDELADAAPQFFPLDYSIATAKAHDMVFMDHTGTYLAPWWMRNRFPRDIVQWDPYAISGWNGLSAMLATHLSQHASDAAYAYAQRFTAAAVEHLKSSAGDQLGCFRVTGGGHPGDEMGLHHLSTEFMDYDEAGQQAFRRWLRQTRKLDLAALGLRWHGDPHRYKAWDQVQIPSHFEFFGAFGQGTFDLLQGWLWRPDSPQAEAEGWHKPDYRPHDEWTPTDLAPSMSQLFLFGSSRDRQLRQGKSTVAWFRKEFDARDWLLRHRDQDLYVVAQVGDPATEPVEVFLNGDYLGPIRPKTVRCGPIAFKASGLIHPGRNVLCLKVQEGVIRGPVFLTTEQPKRYPYLSTTENARWVDLRDWTAQKLTSGWKREAALGRQCVPDVPLMFCPGSCLEFSDQFLDLKRQLGIASLHFTGGGSNYMPWWAGLGYTLGIYATSEEGSTIPEPAQLSRELAWMLLNAQGHHNFYYGAVDYMKLEQQTGWFTKHARLLELLGKAAWQKPAIAVLRAARSNLYFPYDESTHHADIGFGELQAAHYPNVYVTEAEIEAGLAADYPLVFDTGTSVFDDRLLAAVERYVRCGGTFVAISDTGRHALLQADTWPIARLSGFKVLGSREGSRVTVAAHGDWLKRLAGRTFDNSSGIALQATDPANATVLARWQDGAVAAAVRKLGRGRIVVLGANFWRSKSDRPAGGPPLATTAQSAFFADLCDALGIAKPADVDSEDVWVRRLVTKNGLQDWVMTYNSGRAAIAGLTLSFPLERRPRRLLDVVSGKPVGFTWEHGAIRVSGLNIAANTMRIFAVDSSDAIAAVQHWFAEKRRFESRAAAPLTVERLPSPPPTAVVMDAFRFRQVQSTGDAGSLGSSWLAESTAGPAWQDAGYGFWDEMGFAAHGIGLYRRSFHVPAAWQGHRVLLAFVSFDYPVFLERAQVYVNAQPVGDYRGHGWSNFDVLDITQHLHQGDNAVAAAVEAREVRGGYIGQMVAYPLENLEEPIELRSGWKLFADNRQFAPATFPLKAVGRHLETDVTLPATWNGKQIFLEFEVSDRWVGCVVVNGRVIGYNQSFHPYPNIMQINLYPWAKPGQSNRIELWPRTPEETAKARMIVKSVRIGTVQGF